MVKKLKYFLLLCTFILGFTAFTVLKNVNASPIKIIVIDPGHGGKDPGCSGAIHNEKEIALAVALRLGKLLEDNLKDVKVIYTRTTDVFVELEDRAQIANKAKADLFISIHCNAAGKPVMIKDAKTGKKRIKTYKNKKGKVVVVEKPNPLPFGTETYVMGLKNEEGKMKVATRENSAIFYEEDYEKKYGGFDPESEESYIIMSNYTSAYVIQSASLAMKIQDEYIKKAGRVDKGVHRQSIWVLWRTSMPSILTELGYLTNPLEESFLGSEKGQDYLAKSIFKGIRRYKDESEGKKKEYDDAFENLPPLENENIKAGNNPMQRKTPEDDDEDVNSVEKEKPVVSETPVVNAKPLEEKKEERNKEIKEQLNDDPFVKIEIARHDSLPTKPLKTDTALSAKEIALRFRLEKEKKDSLKKTLKNNAADKPIKSPHAVVFKVQFLSSDTPLNLNDPRFELIIEGDFYKVNALLKYTSGNFTALKEAIAHQYSLRAHGFKDCFVVAFENGERIDINKAKTLSGQ
jgi:N-acetylmuramoyl-L-alanine amidase